MVGNLGIIGRARVGKDTAGAWLVANRGYERVGFADPLKEAALKLDPIVGEYTDMGVTQPLRLSRVVQNIGWDAAKDAQPESRRILQEFGMAIRAIDPDFWLRAALAKVAEINAAGKPVVITDVRFLNEANSLKASGFKLIHIDRPGVPHLDHASEGAIGPEDAHCLVNNDGTVDDMYEALGWIADEVALLESLRRKYATL